MSPPSSTKDVSSSKSKNSSKQAASAPADQSLISGNSKPSNLAKPISDPPTASSSPPVSPSLQAANVRTITPVLAKATTRLDAVTSTLSSITAHANRGWTSLVAASASPRTGPANTAISPGLHPSRGDGAISPVYDAFENSGESHMDDASALAEPLEGPSSDSVVWSRWDTLGGASRSGSRLYPVLITAYKSGALQLLQLEADQLKEVLNINATHLGPHGTPDMRAVTLAGAAIRAPTEPNQLPELLVVLHTPIDRQLELVSYSLSKHTVTARQHLRSPEGQCSSEAPVSAELQTNERFTCVALSPCPSIHVLRSDTLGYAMDPISDVALNADLGIPILSLSGRLLAYASTRPASLAEIIAETKQRDGARSRSSTFGQNHLSVVDVRDHVIETSAHVGDVARRLGGGVLSGMRTLGEWGSSYLSGSPSSPPTQGYTGTSPYSQSAPSTAHSIRPGSSGPASPMLSAADKNRSKRTSLHADREGSRDQGSVVTSSNVVRIVDLGSKGRTITAFSPSPHPLSTVSLSPSGQLCLTADSLGHVFHIFELQFAGAFGGFATTDAAMPVLHRYKLHRGVTSAEVLGSQWSQDAQWVAVGTRTGTTHLYPINPYGGPVSVVNHTSGKIRNALSMPPLSVNLNSIVRTARPMIRNEDRAQKPGHPTRPANGSQEDQRAELGQVGTIILASPAFLLLDAQTTFALEKEGSKIRSQDHPPGVCLLEVLTFDPKSVSVSLHKVAATTATSRTQRDSQDEDGADAHASIDSSSTAASQVRTSGLTQMMRRAGGGLIHGDGQPRLVAECSRVAAWTGLEGKADAEQVCVVLAPPSTSSNRERRASSRSGRQTRNWVAKAEIETYSQAPRVLPRSIYLSRQCYFFAYDRQVSMPEHFGPILSSIHRTSIQPIAVRAMVTTLDSAGTPFAGEGSESGFDDRLAGALDDMAFDQLDLDAQSPSSRIPSFPQGQRGRSGGWRTGSIPIRMVAEGIGGGIYRAGRELGRGVDMARRRTSGGSGPEARHGRDGSLSFDGKEQFDLLNGLGGSARLIPGYANSGASPSRTDQASRSGDSQPSSAETPLTGFSEAEAEYDAERKGDKGSSGVDEDDLDWDSFADQEFGGKARPARRVAETERASTVEGAAEDFAFGDFDEDDVMGRDGGRQSTGDGATPGSDETALVYSLRGSSAGRTPLGRSGVLGQETERGVSPSLSHKSDSTTSVALGEGGKETKETHTSIPGSLPATPAPSVAQTGGKKKSKKGHR